MLHRIRANDVLLALQEFPVTALTGPRQVGKTTLAHSLLEKLPGRAVYLDLERPSDLARLAEAEIFLRGLAHTTVVLDEIQRMPELFPLIRSLVDEDRRPGRFLILGSASPELLRQSSESLAGRITYLELPPILLQELPGEGHEAMMQLWVRGGFPSSLLAPSDAASMRWRNSFMKTYTERDLPMLGMPADPMLTLRFLTMVASLQGQVWNAQNLGRSLDLSHPTINRYRDYLESAYLVRVLQPYHTNIRKRLVKSPKVYVRDSGLLHALARIVDLDQLLGHPLSGFSWEGFVIEQILAIAPPELVPCFISTHQGAEADLLLVSGNKPIAAFEIKFSNAPVLPRGFAELVSHLGAQHNFIVTPGSERYPMAKDINAISLVEVLEVVKGL